MAGESKLSRHPGERPDILPSPGGDAAGNEALGGILEDLR
jgi:hypothetical protein